MGLGAVVGVLKVVDKVLSNDRVKGALCATPAPAINGQDQRLDVVIVQLELMNARLAQLVELQAEALRFAARMSGPAQTMDVLPDTPLAQQAAEAAGIDLAEHEAFEQRVADDIARGGALRMPRLQRVQRALDKALTPDIPGKKR